MPGCGSAGSAMPGSAPSTPASKLPSRDTTRPASNSAVSSPRYQIAPSASCAYQSKVSSTSSSPRVTVSRTTRASMPFAMRFVSEVTVMRTVRSPSGSVSRYTHCVPGVIGQ